MGLHSPNEHVAVNFGTSPFLFDIEGYVEDERRQKLAELGKIPVDVGDMQLLIRGYLLHNAYESTFRTFASSANIALGPRDSLTANHSDHPHKNAADTVEKSPFFTKGDSEKMLFTLERRSELRKLVLSGKAARAMELALQHFPGITSLSFYSRLKLLLLCQIFVETVREGREDRDDRCLEMLNGGGLAEYWRGDTQPVQQPSKRPRTAKEDGKHCSDRIGRRSTEISPEHEEEKRLLEDVTSLLAYPDPAKSPQAWLLGDSQRERVADVLNAAVLGEFGYRQCVNSSMRLS